jgi:hypothetical protein
MARVISGEEKYSEICRIQSNNGEKQVKSALISFRSHMSGELAWFFALGRSPHANETFVR